MLAVYRKLLLLYPAEYRELFGEEMTAVLRDEIHENANKKLFSRARFFAREIVGLVNGALHENFRVLLEMRHELSLLPGRFAMRNGFRFPKSTIIFMTLILAGIIMAIKRGEEIAASLSQVNTSIGPIQPAHSTLLPPIALVLALFYAAGLIGWAILFALRRSGVHRLDNMSAAQK